MEAGLSSAGVTHADLYGEEENLLGEENHSSSSKQGLASPSSAHVSQVPLGSWAMTGTPAAKPRISSHGFTKGKKG